MDDIAQHIRWTTIVGIVLATTVILAVVNAINGDPFVSSTYAISAPIALAVCLVGLAVVKRRRG